MSATIRVVLAEDQTMVLGALSALLELEPDIAVVARAANGRDALDAVARLSPNVLVTDIEMPIMTGLELAANLRTSHPAVRTIIHHLCPSRLSSPRTRRRRARLSPEGSSCNRAGRRRTTGSSRSSRR